MQLSWFFVGDILVMRIFLEKEQKKQIDRKYERQLSCSRLIPSAPDHQAGTDQNSSTDQNTRGVVTLKNEYCE